MAERKGLAAGRVLVPRRIVRKYSTPILSFARWEHLVYLRHDEYVFWHIESVQPASISPRKRVWFRCAGFEHPTGAGVHAGIAWFVAGISPFCATGETRHLAVHAWGTEPCRFVRSQTGLDRTCGEAPAGEFRGSYDAAEGGAESFDGSGQTVSTPWPFGS